MGRTRDTLPRFGVGRGADLFTIYSALIKKKKKISSDIGKF